MQLLVSVAGVDDAAAALDGGADIIDAKDPDAGPLGAVSIATFRDIYARVGGARPVSAALGDAHSDTALARAARAFADAGATFVKVGFAARIRGDLIERVLAGVVRSAGDRCGVVAVTYADAAPLTLTLPRIAARAGAAGVLVDTADKRGPGLCQLISPHALSLWVRQARHAGLTTAVAGRLSPKDVPVIASARPDIAGVRGAVCDGGRAGRVAAEKVRRCRTACASFGALQEAT